MKFSRMAIFFVPCLLFITSCSPNSTKASETSVPTIPQETFALSTSTPTATASQTTQPSVTSVPPTITVPPTPDYSQITMIGAYAIQGQYGNFTQVILDIGNLQGEFIGIVGTDQYKCEPRTDIPTQINCVGLPVIKDRQIKFSLFLPAITEPIFSTSFLLPGAIPTPEGMVCEIEPLWTDVIRARGYYAEPGCYAVSCWLNGTYYGGVQDSCKEYWPWIPPGLFPTPLPTP
jgi:hypothetical protein